MNTNMPSLKSAISEKKLSSRALGGSPVRERTAVDSVSNSALKELIIPTMHFFSIMVTVFTLTVAYHANTEFVGSDLLFLRGLYVYRIFFLMYSSNSYWQNNEYI